VREALERHANLHAATAFCTSPMATEAFNAQFLQIGPKHEAFTAFPRLHFNNASEIVGTGGA
jgi:hypothetical protein